MRPGLSELGHVISLGLISYQNVSSNYSMHSESDHHLPFMNSVKVLGRHSYIGCNKDNKLLLDKSNLGLSNFVTQRLMLFAPLK